VLRCSRLGHCHLLSGDSPDDRSARRCTDQIGAAVA
jgi:hypothetical protein